MRTVAAEDRLPTVRANPLKSNAADRCGRCGRKLAASIRAGKNWHERLDGRGYERGRRP